MTDPVITTMGASDNPSRISELEARLAASEARIRELEATQTPQLNYQTLFDSNQLVQLVVDPDTLHIVEANPAAAQFYGYSRLQLRGMAFSVLNVLTEDALHARFLDLATNGIVDGVLTETNRLSCQHITADGIRCDVDVLPASILFGERSLWLLTVIEVSNRIQMKLELQKSEELFRQVGEIAGVGGWELDLNTMTVIWSSYVYHIHGLPEGQMPDLDQAINFYAPEARPIIAAAVDNAINNGTAYDLELPFINAKGESLWVRTMGRPVFRNGECVKLYGVFQDVTEQHHAATATRESEERYRLLSDLLADYAVVTRMQDDGHLEPEWMIGGFEGITGYTQEESAELDGWSSLVHPEDKNLVNEVMDRILATDQPQTYLVRYRIIRKDGQIRHVESANRPEYDSKTGKLQRVYGAVRDITDYIQAIHQLELSEERYRMVSDLIADYAFVLRAEPDRTLRREWLIGGFERITGYTPEETIGASGWTPEVHPEDRHIVQNVIRKMFQADQPRNFPAQYRIIRKDGAIRYIDSANLPEYDPDTGELRRIYGAARDITERVRIVQELADSEERYRAVVQNQLELICQYTTDFELTFVNEAFCRFYGEPLDDLLGISLLTLLDKAAREMFVQTHAEFNVSHASVRVTSRLRGPDGEPAIIEWKCTPIYDPGDHMKHVLAVGHDITDRLRAEDQARRLEFEKARTKVLAEFIHSAAHEFRTPLTTIGSSTYLMVRTDEQVRRQERADQITTQIERVTRLVDMLSRMAALDGNPELRMGPVRIASLLRQLIDGLQVRIMASQLTVTVDLPEDDIVVYGDATLLIEGLTHFLDNAIRYNNEGGSIILRGHSEDDDFQLRVTDTGDGMDAGAVKHLFDRFFRMDTAHTTPGLGLGASIGARIIELHRGHIRVHSTVNVGTTLTITLPLYRAR